MMTSRKPVTDRVKRHDRYHHPAERWVTGPDPYTRTVKRY
jgi:hypothetical protein